MGSINYHRPDRHRPTPAASPQPNADLAPAEDIKPHARVALPTPSPTFTLTRTASGDAPDTLGPLNPRQAAKLRLAGQHGFKLAIVLIILSVTLGIVDVPVLPALLVLAALVSAGGAVAGRVFTSTQQSIRDRHRDEQLAVADDDRWETLETRAHAHAFPGTGHERWAVSVDEVKGRTAVSLLRYRDASDAHQEKVQVWEQERRSFPAGSDPADMRQIVERFADQARDYEGQAYSNAQAMLVEGQRAAERERRAKAAVDELRAAARGAAAGHMTAGQALAARRHATDFPGIAHKAFCVQLTEVDGRPTVRLLGFNPAFPGRPERTESFTVKEQSFEPTVTVAELSEKASEWAIQARRMEWAEFQPHAEAAEQRAQQELVQQAREELEAEMREEARSTIEAAQRALGT